MTKVILISVAIFTSIWGLLYLAMLPTVSDGARMGTLVKVTRKGLIIKTYEAELQYNDGGMQVWDFSIPTHGNFETAVNALASGDRVEVKYHEKIFVPFWVGDTDYLATNITPIGVKHE